MIHVGTSGWQYDSWRKRFYPRDVPKAGWLAYFSERFPTVEVNNSFYRLPSGETFSRWRRESTVKFCFAVKASRFITHVKRLREGAEPVKLLWSRAGRLGGKRGPVLFQLPPRFRADPGRLEEFLGVLPRGLDAAFEFRDRSWETDEIYALLDGAGAAYVLADRPDAKVADVVTGGWSYIRFHKGRRLSPGYPAAKLRRWADRIAVLPARNVYVYFNNDEEGAAVRDALRLTRLLEERGQSVAGAAA